MIRGSCLCGGVAFEAESRGLFRYCHCSRCRKARGSAFAANLYLKPADFRWIRGADQLIDYKLPTAERFGNAFCRVCGSPMPRYVAARDFFVIPAGSLDEDSGLRPQCHIFTGSKAPWHEIADRIQQYEEYPPPA
ncbi:MAG TPA: GFA family protein [Candidatus Binataceae bacterium]|nr:GFA family protein [Candidatus Binataceae bacterium]